MQPSSKLVLRYYIRMYRPTSAILTNYYYTLLMFYRNFITLRPFHLQGPLELYNFLQHEVHAHVDNHVTTPHIFILPRLVRNTTTKKQLILVSKCEIYLYKYQEPLHVRAGMIVYSRLSLDVFTEESDQTSSYTISKGMSVEVISWNFALDDVVYFRGKLTDGSVHFNAHIEQFRADPPIGKDRKKKLKFNGDGKSLVSP